MRYVRAGGGGGQRTFTANSTGRVRTMAAPKTFWGAMLPGKWSPILRQLLLHSTRVGVAAPVKLPTVFSSVKDHVSPSALRPNRAPTPCQPAFYLPPDVIPEGMLRPGEIAAKTFEKERRQEAIWGPHVARVTLRNTHSWSFARCRAYHIEFLFDLVYDAAKVIPYPRLRKKARKAAHRVLEAGRRLPPFTRDEPEATRKMRRKIMNRGLLLLNTIQRSFGR